MTIKDYQKVEKYRMNDNGVVGQFASSPLCCWCRNIDRCEDLILGYPFQETFTCFKHELLEPEGVEGVNDKLALVIATRNRPQLVSRLLQSLKEQTIQPSQLIIVDSSDKPADYPNCDYIYAPESRGLTRQKNIGIKHLKPDITLVGFLDDDITMSFNAVESMMLHWWQAPKNIGGSAFNIADYSQEFGTSIRTAQGVVRIREGNSNYSHFTKFFRWLFCLGIRPGCISRTGFAFPKLQVRYDCYVEHLSGGVTVWRREVVEKYAFDEKIGGTGYTEDIDYCLRVGKQYNLAIVSRAFVDHKTSAPKARNPLRLKERYYIVRKHKLSRLLFLWSMLGVLIMRIIGNIMPEERGVWLNRVYLITDHTFKIVVLPFILIWWLFSDIRRQHGSERTRPKTKIRCSLLSRTR